MAAVALLVAGTLGMFVRPRGIPLWAAPAVTACIALAAGEVPGGAAPTLRLLREPLAFLAAAVPLAVALDRLGVFSAIAGRIADARHLPRSLWILCAVTTTMLNLDAAVVLLTPLYIRIAARYGYDVEAFAFQPALLACLASSALPVSNLTNLIVAERFGLHAGDFARHLLLPTIAAASVGWLAYRRCFPPHLRRTVVIAHDDSGAAAALRRGVPVLVLVVVGFTLGDATGVPAWAVAVAALIWTAAINRWLPWRAVPWEAMAVALSLALLVAAAVPHLGLGRLLGPGRPLADLRALGFGAVGSVLTNNIPAALAGSAVIEPAQSWALLVGVNVAPVMVFTGSLSALLWRDTARRLGLSVSPRRYSAVGVRVGLPALVVAGALVLL